MEVLRSREKTVITDERIAVDSWLFCSPNEVDRDIDIRLTRVLLSRIDDVPTMMRTCLP